MEIHYFCMFDIWELGNIYNVLVSFNILFYLLLIEFGSVEVTVFWDVTDMRISNQISYLSKFSAFYELDLDSGR